MRGSIRFARWVILVAAWRRPPCAEPPAQRGCFGIPAFRRRPAARPAPRPTRVFIQTSEIDPYARSGVRGPKEESMALTTVLSERIRPERLRPYEELVKRLAKRAVQKKEAWRWTAHQTAFGEVGSIHYVS